MTPDEFRRRQTLIKDVEREFWAMRLAVDRLSIQSAQDVTILRAADVRLADVARASDRLEATYFVRLFSEFEMALRDYWRTVRDTQPKTEDLINAVGSRRRVRIALIQDVHAARLFRNTLVHEQYDAVSPVTIAEARRATCQFLK